MVVTILWFVRLARCVVVGVVGALCAGLVPVVEPTPAGAQVSSPEAWPVLDDAMASAAAMVADASDGLSGLGIDWLVGSSPSATSAPSSSSEASAAGHAVPASAESSSTEAPGEWAMGNRNLARTGNAAWEEFVSPPLSTRWAAGAGDKVQVNPAVVDDVAYFGGAGTDRRVYAVDLQDGTKVEWSVRINGSVLSSPAVTGRWVYFGGADGRLYQVAAGRAAAGGGQRGWVFPRSDQDPVGAIIGAPAVAGGVVYFGSHDGNVYAVDAARGELLWSAPTPKRVVSAVTVTGGRVIATSGVNEYVTALDASTGAQLWQRHLFVSDSTTLLGTAASVSGGRVFVTGFDATLRILNLADGTDAAAPAAMSQRGQNTPVLAAERVFVGTNAGRVHAFTRDGAPVWNIALPGGGIAHSPIYASGRLFVSSTSGRMNVLDATTGAVQWTFVAGPMFAPPSVVSNYVLVGSDDRRLYGLGPGLPSNVTFSGQPFGHFGPGYHPAQHYEADPVSTSTGNFWHEHTDIAAMAGRGMPVALSRTYNSLTAGADGPLGHGWTHNWMTRIDATPGGVLLTWGDGRVDRYVEVSPGVFDGPPDTHEVLSRTAGGFELAAPGERVVWGFDSGGRLVWVSDRSGNVTTLGYTGGRLTTVTDASGRAITFGYNGAGRVTSATDPVGGTWLYRYDGAGNLIEVDNPAGQTWVYAYDGAHRMVEIVDPGGDRVVFNTYDGATGRVATQLDGEGGLWTYSYGPGATEVTDPSGVSYTAYFDANYRTTRIVDAAGLESRWVYDGSSNLVATVDPAGVTQRFAYDDRGNLTAALGPLGHKTGFVYDSDGNLVEVIDLKGGTTTYTYDTAGRPVAVRAPTGETTTVAYRADGLVESVTDNTGARTTFAYDAAGLLTGITDPLGRTTSVALRADGYPLAFTDPTGATSTLAYDPAGRITSATDPNGAVTTWSYTPRGLVSTTTNPNGATTTYAYDRRGLLTKVTDPLGRASTYTYDPAGRPTGYTDARGVTVTRVYDPAGRLVRIQAPDLADTVFVYDTAGRTKSVSDAAGTVTYTYDRAGRIAAEHHDRTGARIDYAWDMLGRRAQVRLHRGDVLAAWGLYRYDASGRPTEVIDRAGGLTRFAYDTAGRTARIEHANGSITSYGYDPAGQLIRIANLPTSMTDLDGNTDGPLVHLIGTLDALDELATRLTAQENLDAIAHAATVVQTLAENFAAGGLTLSAVLGLIADTAHVVDAVTTVIDTMTDPDTLAALRTLVAEAGRLVHSLPAGTPADQLTDLVEDLEDLTNEIVATATGLQNEIVLLGRLTANALRLARAIIAGEPGDTEIDAILGNLGDLLDGLPEDLDRIARTITAAEAVLVDLLGVGGGLQSDWTYTYDPAGRITGATRRFVTTSEELLSFTNTYTYDPAGRLTGTTSTDPAAAAFGNATYGYDPAGNRTTVAVAGLAPLTAIYDAADQLIADSTHTYSYDPAGNMVARTPITSEDPEVTYTWDSLGRLAAVTAGEDTVHHVYDHLGRRTRTTTPTTDGGAHVAEYHYDGWDLLHATHPGTTTTTGDVAHTTLAGRVLNSIYASDGILYDTVISTAISTDPGTSAGTDTGGSLATRVHYHHDAIGNVAETTDGFGNAIVRNAYSPWGQTTSILDPATDPTGGAGSEYGYSGAWGVRNTTTPGGLLDMRHRTYDPALGVFISRDPALEAITGDPYRYAGNNPINHIDPWGLCSILGVGPASGSCHETTEAARGPKGHAKHSKWSTSEPTSPRESVVAECCYFLIRSSLAALVSPPQWDGSPVASGLPTLVSFNVMPEAVLAT